MITFVSAPLKGAAGALPIMADYAEFKAWWQKR